MKKTFFILFLGFFSLLDAQTPTFPIGTSWTYEFINYSIDWHYPSTHTITDTVQWHGSLAYKIEPGFEAAIDYIKQEDGKIWYWHPHNEVYQLQYDFNATDYFITEVYFGSADPGTTDTIFIDSVGIQNINGVDHTVQYLNVGSANIYVDESQLEIIKNIGPKRKSFYLRIGYDEAPGFFHDFDSIWCFDNTVEDYQFVEFSCDTSWATSIDPLNNESLKIYPNPTVDKIIIDKIGVDYNLTLYNALGELLYSQNDIKDKVEVDLSTYIPGIYYLKFKADGYAATKKIIRKGE